MVVEVVIRHSLRIADTFHMDELIFQNDRVLRNKEGNWTASVILSSSREFVEEVDHDLASLY